LIVAAQRGQWPAMDLPATALVAAPDLLLQLGRIFYFIVLPMLLLAGIGYLIQRKVGLDMPTLTRLNFHFVVPGIIYASVVSAHLTPADAGQVVGFCVLLLALMGALTYAVALVRKVPRDVRNGMLMSAMFNNSGNYGLPLQDLAFRAEGLSATATGLQTFYMIVQNVGNFTLGVLLAAGGRKDRHWKRNLLHIVRFPPMYALAAALATLQIRAWLGEAAGPAAKALTPSWTVIEYVRNAFVAVALCTLGAQLAAMRRNAATCPVKTSVFLRLLVGPALGLALVVALGLEGLVGQVLLIGSSTPTAVNVLLLSMEFDNHPEFAARAVLYSTLLSPVTLTLTIFLAQGGLLSQLALP